MGGFLIEYSTCFIPVTSSFFFFSTSEGDRVSKILGISCISYHRTRQSPPSGKEPPLYGQD